MQKTKPADPMNFHGIVASPLEQLSYMHRLPPAGPELLRAGAALALVPVSLLQRPGQLGPREEVVSVP